jgi:hypothetical protein
MKRAAFSLALLAFAACGATKSDSMVVVTVTAPATLVNVTQLCVTVSNAGSTDVQYFPETNAGVPISFTNSFALSLPKTRQGDLGILVEGLDANSQVVASGSGTARIAVGGRADITIDLGIPGTTPPVPDSGPPGSGGAGGGPDAGAGTRWDASGVGGSTGHDGPVRTGTGGIVGTGGVRGTGGTGSGANPGAGDGDASPDRSSSSVKTDTAVIDVAGPDLAKADSPILRDTQPGCSYGGQTYAPGTTVVVPGYCGTCICLANGTVNCTPCGPDSAAPPDNRPADVPVVTCTQGGVAYSPGQSVPRADGCPGSCVCLASGQVGSCSGGCLDR